MKLRNVKPKVLILLLVITPFIALAQEVELMDGYVEGDDDTNQYSNNKIPTSVGEVIHYNQYKKIIGNEKITNDALIILSGNGEILSCNLESLAVNWKFKFTDSSYNKMRNSFNIENAILYASSTQIELVALNVNDGSLYWKTELGQQYEITRRYWINGQELPIKNDLIYLASGNKNAYAFNKLTGNLAWNYELQFPYNNYSPAIQNDYLIIPNAPWVYCFEASTGKPIWQRGFGNKPMYAKPQIDNIYAYVADENNMIYALSLENNAEIIWEYETDYEYAGIDEKTILEEETYYFGAKTGRETPPAITALNSKDGSLIWRTVLSNESNEIKVLKKFGNYILGFTDSESNSFYLINTETGEQITVEEPKEKAVSNIVEIDDVNVAFLAKNYLVTFNISTKKFTYREAQLNYKLDETFNIYIAIIKSE